MERQKWRSRKENIKVGDLVLLADENYPRGEWPIARVWEVVADDDGCVRVAKVKIASTVARNLALLCLHDLSQACVVWRWKTKKDYFVK